MQGVALSEGDGARTRNHRIDSPGASAIKVDFTKGCKAPPELVSPRVSVTPQTAAADARLAAVVEALALAWPGMSEATRKELEKIVGACRCGKM